MAGTGIRFGDVELSDFVTVSSGPLTDKFSKLEAAQRAGAGAASLKLTFVDVPFQSEMRSYSMPGSVIISPTNRRLDLKNALEIMSEARNKLSMTMFVNYSAVGTKLDEWSLMSEEFTSAGADILEPNLCCPNLDTADPASSEKHDHGGASIGENVDACARVMKCIVIPAAM